MPKKDEEFNDLVSDSKRLFKAIEILHQKYSDKQIAQEISKKEPWLGKRKIKEGISPASFSRHKNFGNNTENKPNVNYLGNVNRWTMERLIIGAESLLRDRFNLEWKVNNYVRVLVPLPNLEILVVNELRKKIKKELEGLCGFWKGYSWNKSMSDRFNTGHINVFKMHVKDLEDILCITQEAMLTGELQLIDKNQLIIELKCANRHIYMLSRLAEGSNKENSDLLNFLYVDTGVRRVRSGKVILKKISEGFEEIITGRYPIGHLSLDKGIIESLKDTQIIL